MACPFPHHAGENAATAEGSTSWETYCEATVARRFDLHAWQRTFPDTAAKYFRASKLTAAEIGAAYGVSARTGQNWIDGIVAPAGNKVALIAKKDPKGFWKFFVGDAA